MLIGMSCEHSLGGSQALTKFCKSFTKFYDASGGPECSQSAQNGQNLLLSVHQPAQNSKQTKIKDAQKHFRSVLGYEGKLRKISKLFFFCNFRQNLTKELKLKS
jgi:hypothetical protein